MYNAKKRLKNILTRARMLSSLQVAGISNNNFFLQECRTIKGVKAHCTEKKRHYLRDAKNALFASLTIDLI